MTAICVFSNPLYFRDHSGIFSFIRSLTYFARIWNLSELVRPHPGQLTTCGANARNPIDWRISRQTCTSVERGAPGSGVRDARMVSPIPCWRSIERAAAEELMPLVPVPASVSQRWSGYSQSGAIRSYAPIICCRVDIFTEIMIRSLGSPHSTAFSAEMIPDSTIVSI